MWRKDEHYDYRLVEEYDNYRGVKGYVFELTSQKWLDESVYYIKKSKGKIFSYQVKINHNFQDTIWRHWIAMWVPVGKKVDKDLLGRLY